MLNPPSANRSCQHRMVGGVDIDKKCERVLPTEYLCFFSFKIHGDKFLSPRGEVESRLSISGAADILSLSPDKGRTSLNHVHPGERSLCLYFSMMIPI